MPTEGKSDMSPNLESAEAEIKRLKIELASKDVIIASLEEQLGQDHLTGLFNMRMFEKRVGGLIEKINKTSGSRHETTPPNEAMLIVLDVDHLKMINNDFGHLAGDEALKTAATRLKEVAKREEDVAFRIGGDEKALWFEFNDAVSVPDEKLAEFFKKIKKEVNERLFIEIEIDDKKGGKIKEKIPITFAMGYSVLRRDKYTTIKELRKEADENQLADKEAEIKAARIKAAREAIK